MRRTEERSKLAETRRRQTDFAATIKRFEQSLENTDISPADRRQIESEIAGDKRMLESLATEEQQRLTAEMEAEEQLHAEQAKLSGLEDRMDRLEKELESPH